MHLQIEIEENIDRLMRDKIERRIFGPGWPKRKCHNDESSCFAWKLKDLECMEDADRVEVLEIR